ncbi:NUDIX hydrolase [Actinomadura syzygii]|uniref:NUDIX hydrolase n=1 Tax=Actinomadura syzygii TaxID=1427538 RepID=A0A5D0UDH0_9ACTN|nr:NUDIX hydrolase [Actinomadura syzygii]TYC16104.1 NUDIX hydrolase [Actinomadura syzygii]
MAGTSAAPTSDDDPYERLRRERPALFANPPGAGYEILPVADASPERGPYGVQYRDPFVTLVRDPVRFPDGQVGGYVRLLARAESGGAAILPIIGARVVLIRHFRHATRDWHWEIPRGFSDPGETPEETAHRELVEELGVAPQGLRRLGMIHVDSGLSAMATTLYATTLPALAPHETRDEAITERGQFTADELDALLAGGELTDSFTMGAVLHARRLGLLP